MTTRISDFCMGRAHRVRMCLRNFGLLWKENVMVTSNCYDPLAGAIYACAYRVVLLCTQVQDPYYIL